MYMGSATLEQRLLEISSEEFYIVEKKIPSVVDPPRKWQLSDGFMLI